MNWGGIRRQGLAVASTLLILASLNEAAATSSNPTPDCSAVTTCTITFTYTGDYYNWTVPTGATSITFDVRGAAGGVGKVSGSGTGGNGLGGRVQGTLTTTVGSSLLIYVGGEGGSGNGANTGGFNGGANGATTGTYTGGGGGGSSDIRTSTASSTRLVVAGGGGGGGLDAGNTQDRGGLGGGLTGGQGYHFNAVKAGGGTPSSGGSGEVYGGWTSGSSGVLLTGGVAGSGTGGGGGGGGYYGGGGGSWGGGGGGSSYTDAALVSGASHTQGYQSGAGQIIITYPKVAVVSNTTLSLAGNTRIATYRVPIVITAAVDQPGKVTFYWRGKKIKSCTNVLVVSSSATCSWAPSVRGSQSISASLAPSNGATASSATLSLNVVNRMTTR